MQAHPERRRRRRLLADTCGHAYAEAVIMMPALLIIWGCITYVAQSFDEAVIVNTTTRQHAWAHAMPGCTGGVGGGTSMSGGPGPPMADTISPLGRALPIAGPVFPPLWPEEHRYERHSSVERPAVLDPGSNSISKYIVVTCNETRKGSYLEAFKWAAWAIWGY